MNILRHRINEETMGLEHEGIYIGNKIVRGNYKGQTYFDVSLNKEIFIKKGSTFLSLSDFSNMQKLWKDDRSSNLEVGDDILVSHQEFPITAESEESVHYAILLRAAWKYLGGGATMEQVKEFVVKYNKKLLPVIYKHIKDEDLQISNWWYCGGEFTPEEDLVEIVSTSPENLPFTLATVSGNMVDYHRIAKKTMRR